LFVFLLITFFFLFQCEKKFIRAETLEIVEVSPHKKWLLLFGAFFEGGEKTCVKMRLDRKVLLSFLPNEVFLRHS